MRFGTTCSLLMLLFTSSANAGLNQGVPIKVVDELGLERRGELVRLSVPLGSSEGILQPEELRLVDSEGQEVPVQWRVLTRWRAAPQNASRPVRFALARFLVDLDAGQTRHYELKRRRPSDGDMPLPDQPVHVFSQEPRLSIGTGPARFDFDTRTFNLFQNVLIDLDGDGVLEAPAGEKIVRYLTSVGSGLVDRMDGFYTGMLDFAPDYSFDEVGPLVTVLRVDGRQMPASPNAISRDYLLFTARFYFVSGSPTVRVEYSLKNSYLENPLGSVTLARFFLHTKTTLSPGFTTTFGQDAETSQSLTTTLGPGEEAFLLQDSAGGPYWNQAGTTFNGWRAYQGPSTGLRPESLPPWTPIGSGSRAQGWIDQSDADKGLLVLVRHAWQNYPLALRSRSEGSLLVDLLPAEFAGLHWLDDAQRKTYELFYTFHKAAGFDPRATAWRQAYPLVPVVSAAYLRETRAWGDQGDLRDPGLSFEVMQTNGEGALAQMYSGTEEAGGFNWYEFGEAVWSRNTHTTGSPRNRLTYFDRFVISGARAWFDKEEIFARHSMDLRTYHIDGFRAEEHPQTMLLEGLPHWNSYDQLGRDALDPALDPYRAGIPDDGHRWNGYDGGHMVVDDLYEYYLLTGSWNALDAVSKIAEGMKTWTSPTAGQASSSSRIIGWPLRALMKAYAITGDPGTRTRADDLVQSVRNFRGQLPSPETGLVYHYLSRQTYGAGHHNMTDDYDLPWQIAVGIYGLALYARDTGDTSVHTIIGESSDYIVDYATIGGVVVEALACDNHLDNNPKDSNSGVNSWIASALALAYRITGRDETVEIARDIFEQNPHDFLDAGASYHWYHTIGAEIGR